MGNISLGMALVAGKKRVPNPPTGKMAFLTRDFIISPDKGLKTTDHDGFRRYGQGVGKATAQEKTLTPL
jgi:hypothetical protein